MSSTVRCDTTRFTAVAAATRGVSAGGLALCRALLTGVVLETWGFPDATARSGDAARGSCEACLTSVGKSR